MDIVCYSHLRWNFVYQRPQQLLSRFARHFRVLFIEEPVFDAEKPYLDTQQNTDKVWVIVPHLSSQTSPDASIALQNDLLKDFFDYFKVAEFIAWYYTPMASGLNPAFKPALVIYDCMDELSAFKNAPAEITHKENELMARADIVFTGGSSLYSSKKNKHSNIYLFPSSIDQRHFEKARTLRVELSDQQDIPSPRIGFFGVIDERMDIDLLASIAAEKPQWHFILIGPIVKIDSATLPVNANIHYLGSKTYQELPFYISKWDVAMMPFAINESTKFISPTKTPEYLAAGKPVVSTPVPDVVSEYGDKGLVCIAGTANEFVVEIEKAMNIPDRVQWLKAVDTVLRQNSWDITVEKMMFIINTALDNKDSKTTVIKEDVYV
ncbi:MAG: glycosyltransferase family 1 protein [Chitinophagaceae bacterium]